MKAKVKSHQDDWEHDDVKYPTKRGNCDFCGNRDDLKLSFDRIRLICVNASSCVLRWRKSRGEG